MPSRIFPCKIVVLTIQFIWTLYVTKLIYRYKYKVRACGVRSKKGSTCQSTGVGGNYASAPPPFLDDFIFIEKAEFLALKPHISNNLSGKRVCLQPKDPFCFSVVKACPSYPEACLQFPVHLQCLLPTFQATYGSRPHFQVSQKA